MRKNTYIVALILIFSFSLSYGQTGINFETGLVTSGYNDVQIPKATGTLFSLTDDLKTESKQYYRINLNFDLNERDHFSLLIAPLSLSAAGILPDDIIYENETFAGNSRINAKYKFNSYRLTYRRTILENRRFIIGLGLTGKIREASIVVENSASKAEKKNVGFVPLVNFKIRMNLTNRLFASLEGDALAAPQGRAEDVLISLNYSANNLIGTYFGYRLLEGGANVDEVYNFALLHYLAFGLNINL